MSAPAIAARCLDVSLAGRATLHEVSLTVGAGQAVAVLGGNGSGKTTLLRAILGLVPLSGGEVELFGHPLDGFRDWRRLGYMPQRAAVQVGVATVGEVVTAGRLSHRRVFRSLGAEDRAAIADALETVHLTDLQRKPMSMLSGGQRQRALIARALASRPELVVLDEPLAGLDTDTQEGLAEVLGRLKAAGTAVLVVLHELGPLESILDECTVLSGGRVIYTGPLQSAVSSLGDHHHAHDAAPASLLHDPLPRRRP